MNPSSVEPGRILGGRYRLERCVDRGGMGAIWQAEHLQLSAPVAVKVMDPAVAHSEQAAARFLREARAAASLRSPHVVQILDFGVDDGLAFMVMELLVGETLARRLERRRLLPAAEVLPILLQVVRAMQRAHEAGIVHRDLKPDNIFLLENDDELVAKVLDFGIAKVQRPQLKAGTSTRTGMLLGTPYYMSPEQAQGDKELDHRADLWALAVIAFECLTGSRPFESEALGELVLQICVRPVPVPSTFANVPPGFDAWFARATSRVMEERYSSARELGEALRTALSGGAGPLSLPSAPVAPTDFSHTVPDQPPSASLLAAAIPPPVEGGTEPSSPVSSTRKDAPWAVVEAVASSPEVELSARGAAPTPSSLSFSALPVPRRDQPERYAPLLIAGVFVAVVASGYGWWAQRRPVEVAVAAAVPQAPPAQLEPEATPSAVSVSEEQEVGAAGRRELRQPAATPGLSLLASAPASAAAGGSGVGAPLPSASTATAPSSVASGPLTTGAPEPIAQGAAAASAAPAKVREEPKPIVPELAPADGDE